jgi:hypothetical protein
MNKQRLNQYLDEQDYEQDYVLFTEEFWQWLNEQEEKDYNE